MEKSQYHALKMALRHRNLDMQMKYCRKIHASWLHHCGVQSEIVDLLQGRVPRSVFAKHYLTPSLEYRTKVLDALNTLKKAIDQ